MNSEELHGLIAEGNYIPILDWINRRKPMYSPLLYVEAADMEKIVLRLARAEAALAKCKEQRDHFISVAYRDFTEAEETESRRKQDAELAAILEKK